MKSSAVWALLALAYASSILWLVPSKLKRKQPPQLDLNIHLVRNPAMGMKLPVEVILMILANLSAPERVLFSLTCKAFYFPYNVDVPTGLARGHLLFLLEKDIPNMYHCPDIGKLVYWNPRMGVAYHEPFSFLDFLLFKKKRVEPVLFKNGHYELKHRDALLVMRRNGYGDAYGLPLDRISMDFNDIYSEYGIQIITSYCGRLVQGNPLVQLLIRGTFTVCQLQDTTPSHTLREFIDGHEFRICDHFHTHHERSRVGGTAGVSGVSRRIPDLQFQTETFWSHKSHNVEKSPKIVRSCPCCMTDYTLSVHLGDRHQGSVIQIVVYWLPGPGQPDCSFSTRGYNRWRYSESSGVHEMYFAPYPGCAPGNIMERWESVGNTRTNHTGRWAALPP